MGRSSQCSFLGFRNVHHFPFPLRSTFWIWYFQSFKIFANKAIGGKNINGIYYVISVYLVAKLYYKWSSRKICALQEASTVFKTFRQVYVSLIFDALFSILTKRSYMLIKTHISNSLSTGWIYISVLSIFLLILQKKIMIKILIRQCS